MIAVKNMTPTTKIILASGALVGLMAMGSSEPESTDTSLYVPIPVQNAQNIQPIQKAASAPERSSCHSSYSGCLKVNAGDYDCAGGSGNGPNYTGTVRVTGPDVFDLDRDRDGWGCE